MACNSSDSLVVSTFCRCFWDTLELPRFRHWLRQTNLLGARWFGLRHHCEPLFTTVFVLLDGLTQVGREQAECKVSVISWHSGKLARVARSSKVAELQAAAVAERERKNSPFFVCHFGKSSEAQHHRRNGRKLHPRCPQHWYLTSEQCTMRTD